MRRRTEQELKATPIERVINIMADGIAVSRARGDPVVFVSEAHWFLGRAAGLDMSDIRANLLSPTRIGLLCDQFEGVPWELVPKHAMIVTNPMAAGLIMSIGVGRVFKGRDDLIVASPNPKGEWGEHTAGTLLECGSFEIYYDGREGVLV